MQRYNQDCSSCRRRCGACSHRFLAVRTTVSVAGATPLLCVLSISLCALRKSSLRVLVNGVCLVFHQTLSHQLTQFSQTQPLWPAPLSSLRAASQQLSPMLFPDWSPTLGSPVRCSLPVGHVPRAGFAFSSHFKNRIWPKKDSTICAQGPDWAWLKDVTPAYLFEVAFYMFWRQRATAIARIPDGAVKPCWHDETITGNWCGLATLLNPYVPTQEGQAACGHCKVEEYELLLSCWGSYGWGQVWTHLRGQLQRPSTTSTWTRTHRAL